MRKFWENPLCQLYVLSLKISCKIIPLICLGVTLIRCVQSVSFCFENFIPQLTGICVQLMMALIHGYIIAFTLVTLTFIIFKIFHVPLNGYESFLMSRRLDYRIKMDSSYVMNMIGIALLIWLICFHSEIIASYQIVDGTFVRGEPLLNATVLKQYYPIFLLIYGGGIGYYICRLVLLKEGVISFLIYVIYKASACWLFCVMVSDQQLFNDMFFTTLFSINRTFNYDSAWFVISRMLICINIVGSCFDVKKEFFKSILKRPTP